jgi:hypothetical protein
VADVRRVDDVDRLRATRDLDASAASVAALPGVSVCGRPAGPPTMGRGQLFAVLDGSLDLRRSQVARRSEWARGSAACKEQHACEQAYGDGGGGAAFEHGRGPRTERRYRPSAGFFHPWMWLLRKKPDSCSENTGLCELFVAAPPQTARPKGRLVTRSAAAPPHHLASHPPTGRGFDSGLKNAPPRP